VYDMYPWADPADSASSEPRNLGPHPVPESHPDPEPRRVAADRPAAAVRAVQVALDRRDNGGDGVAIAGQATASVTRQ